MKKKRLLPLGILATLVLAALIYTRPMTLETMFGLDITQSELVYTDYLTFSPDEPGRSVESSEWLRGEERTETLIKLLSQKKFRRSLRNLLPLETTSDMPRNNLIFDADFSFNDGQDYLYFQSSFGQLNLYSTGGNKLMLCTTSGQKAFLQQAYDIISAEPWPISYFTTTGGTNMKKCVSILVGVLAVIAAAAAVLVALDRFRKQTDEGPNDFED